MTEEKRGRGRPKMINGEKRDCIFSIRLSVAELAVVKEAAEKDGVDSASDWARDALLAAIQEAK